jgi:redox-regulated HSP33 family molecular chaperone
LIERLPGDDANLHVEDFEKIEEVVAAVDFESALERICAVKDHTVLEHQALFWMCQCSQERVETVIKMLGAEVLAEMIAAEQDTSVTCHFCNTTRSVSLARLGEMLGACDR